MTKEVNVNIAQGVDVSKPIIIHILDGVAPDPVNPKAVNLKGDIDAVMSYIINVGHTINKEVAVIIFDEDKRQITFCSDPSSATPINVVAKLEPFTDLHNFGINQEKYFGLKELEKFVRMNRMYFSDKEAHTKLAADLKSFTAKIQSELKAESDNRGNRNNAFAKQVTTDLAADFVLFIPIFKGQIASLFRVEICYDVTDSQARFWLESVELAELSVDMVRKTFGEQQKYFAEHGYTVINA